MDSHSIEVPFHFSKSEIAIVPIGKQGNVSPLINYNPILFHACFYVCLYKQMQRTEAGNQAIRAVRPEKIDY